MPALPALGRVARLLGAAGTAAVLLAGCGGGGGGARGQQGMTWQAQQTAVALRARDSGRADSSNSAVAGTNPEAMLSLADLQTTWDVASQVSDEDEDGRSYLVAFQRDPTLARLGNGQYRVLIGTVTVERELSTRNLDAQMGRFLTQFMDTSSGMVDVRSMVSVRGPAVGRRSSWSSIQFRREGVSARLFSVVFQTEGRLAFVATIGHQDRARLEDTAALATDVAAHLVDLSLPDLALPRLLGA